MTENTFISNPLEVIEQEARVVAQCFGVAACDDAAAMLAERIMLRLGGAHLYIPHKRPEDRKRVREAICERFNGRNTAELAREYGVSTRWVRKMVNEL